MARKKGTIEKTVEAAADAAQELGAAALAFKDSGQLFEKAKENENPVTTAAGRAARSVTRAGKNAVRKVTGRRKSR